MAGSSHGVKKKSKQSNFKVSVRVCVMLNVLYVDLHYSWPIVKWGD